MCGNDIVFYSKAEQRALDSQTTEFHDKPHFISLSERLEFKEKGQNLAFIRLAEVEMSC